MAIEIRIPPLGEGIEEAMVDRWEKQVGDSVQPGEVLLRVESDKATVAVEAEAAGRLARRLAEEGDTVAVGSVVAVLD